MARKKTKKSSKASSLGASKPKSVRRRKRRNTPENKRGGYFFRLMKAFFAVNRNYDPAPGKSVSLPFSKKDMADWLIDDFDRDMDDTAAWYDALALSTGASPAAVMPAALRTVKDASKLRRAERAITSLVKAGFVFTRTDAHGKPLRKKAKKQAKSSAKKASAKKKAGSASSTEKVYWTYDPNGPVSRELVSMLSDFNLTGYELEGIVGCSTLLEKLYDLPLTDRIRKCFTRITKSAPTKLYNDILEQKDVWRYLFRRPGKYQGRKLMLQSWNDATILRNQCSLEYKKPGDPNPPQRRTVAALGTIFSPEEDSIFLVGCEADRKDPDKWQRPILYKLDRVEAVEMLDIPNPSLTDVRSHTRVASLPKRGAVDRLDLERLFTDSAGAFFHYGTMITLVVRVHDPYKMALCVESPFHRAQSVVAGPAPGEITITVEQCFKEEMISRLLRLEDGFTVVEPPDMVAEIHRLASGIASRHTPKATP